jgi:NADH:ubiquinone oxidoreductase subunit C
MTTEQLKTELLARHPSLTPEEGGEWLNVQLPPDDWIPLAEILRFSKDFYFDYLFCLTCVDWKTHLTMVYHLTSTRHRHTLVVKINLERTAPEIETTCGLWKTAEFHEREVYELFGVNFLNHPDLRHLILPDDWEGYPLRKDYEDPVNLIKL